MKFKVKSIGPFKEIDISVHRLDIHSGLLDDKEASALAHSMREVADELCPVDPNKLGLEKAMGLLVEYRDELVADCRINEACWVDVAVERIEDELERIKC